MCWVTAESASQTLVAEGEIFPCRALYFFWVSGTQLPAWSSNLRTVVFLQGYLLVRSPGRGLRYNGQE